MTTKCNLMRRGVLPALVLATALTAGATFAGSAGASATTMNAQQEVSQNWSGYVVHSASGQNFSTVSGSWVQPTVNAGSSSGTGYSAFWVGLGGSSQQSQALEQVGTAADVTSGQTTYYAWYELVPSAQQKLSLAIHPGDHIAGKVTVNGTTVTVSLSDQTTGQSVTRTLQMTNPDTSSAEWIAEAPATETPDGSFAVLPLANFGNVTFTDASATADGHAGSISDPNWTVQQVDMSSASSNNGLGLVVTGFDPAGAGQASQSTVGASAGAVSDQGTSFSVSYSADSAAQSTAGSSGSSSGSGDAYGYPGYSGDGYGGYGDGGYVYSYGGYPGVYVYPGA